MKRFFFFCFFFAFLAFARATPLPLPLPSGAIQGKIAEIHPEDRWLSIYSPYGLLFLVLHPQGFVFKEGARSDLSAFRPGDDIVAIRGGIRNRDTVLILALEDWKTYSEKTHAFPEPFQPNPVPPKKFIQIDGKIFSTNQPEKIFTLESDKGNQRDVTVYERTKIYTFAGDRFILLSFDRLAPGQWVRVGGFLSGKKELRAESVLVFEKAPK